MIASNNFDTKFCKDHSVFGVDTDLFTKKGCIMEKKQTEIKKLKTGSFCLVDEVPCIVDKVQKSKAGKHGAAKARLFASGVFTDVKKIIVKPADTTIDVPIIEKRSMQVLAVSESNVQLMDMEDYAQVEVPKSAEIEVHEGDEVLVWRYGKYFMIKGRK